MKICLVCEGVASTDAAVCASCGARLLQTSEIHFPLRRGDEDAAHPLLGTLVDGKYRVVGVLGRGGMGTVLRAMHEVSLVPMALKLLHPRLAARPEYRSQFVAEARKAGRVLHEHTARILDVGETQDGSIYIAQELVPGTTLSEWLQAGEPLPARLVVEILRQVCAALAAAHAVGVVHRDLTPRNVMVDVRQGRPHVKVLDFGIARGAAERAAGGDELTGFASPPYAAPEHLAGQEVDGRADLYGLGVIAYEALSGRVPTPGSTPREFAAATLRGELLPFVPRERLPRALVRLVQRLLARDPHARPESAASVLAELDALAVPHSGRLRVVALGALLAASVAFAVAFRGAPPAAFLRLAPGPGLVLLPGMPRGATPQFLRGSALQRLRFDFGGFDAARLAVEVWHKSEAVLLQELDGEVRGGTLTVDRDRHPRYAALLDALAAFSAHGPVYLKFMAPGVPPLAYAAVRIDDEPPAPSLTIDGLGEDGAVRGSSTVRIDVDERHLASLELRVLRAGAAHRVMLSGELPRTATAAELLGELFPPPLPVHDVELQLVAVDHAGNTASVSVPCPVVDLGAPSIVRVVTARAEARTLLVGAQGVRLRVELDGREPGLSLAFGAVDAAATACTSVVEAGAGLDAAWLPPGGGVPPDGAYQLVVRDRSGNESTFRDVFTFTTSRLDPAFAVLPPGEVEEAAAPRGRAVVAAGGAFADGLPVAFAFQCNPLYRPEAAEVVAVEGGEVVPHAVRLLEAGDGNAQLWLEELRDGRYVLQVRARSSTDGDEQHGSLALLVRREPMVLRVPAPGRARFLPKLVDLGALEWRDGVLGDGRGWSLVPPDARWLRGSIWFGRVRPAAHALPERAGPDADILPRLAPWPGENVLGACLRDALDRPVQVLRGDDPAPVLGGLTDEDGRPVAELVRFLWHDQAPRARSSELRVEYGQPVRFVVDAPLPYRLEDGLDLYLDNAPIRPRSFVPARDGGVTLEFDLPFDRLRAAARLGTLPPERFAGGVRSEPFTVWLSAPDGRHAFEIRARTSRTTLEPVRLGDAGRDLPHSLRELDMVPVLAPGPTQPWHDPVPASVTDRRTFRLTPPLEVRGVEDFFLQQHETTRLQYAEVIEAIVALAQDTTLPVEELVHRGDPLGTARLRLEHLVPRTFADHAAFAHAVRAGPDRPVTGVDWFQAYVFARAVGWLLARDPELFRLPTGVELELAAFGSGHVPDPEVPALNGAARTGGLKAAALAPGRLDASRWPPSARELHAAGDYVVTELGAVLTGIDFGVREWVADLPALGSDRERWSASADHLRHIEAAAELARAPAQSALARELLRFGVVRGTAHDEIDPGEARGGVRLPRSVPGVVRVLQVARDGSGLLPGELDPHLPAIGLRLCGGRAFLHWVRSR